MRERSALLATDMDGTVIPLEDVPERRAEVQEFRRAVEAAQGLTLAYVTGRGIGLAEKGIGQFDLPLPHFQVCDVGTSLYRVKEGSFLPDLEYAARMREAMGGLDFQDVLEHLRPVAHLLLQPWERQTEFKLSYHLPDEEDHLAVVESVRDRLTELNGSVHAVYSVGAPSGRGLLDLLPGGVGKDFALHYLREMTGMEPHQVVYAGDSGNDLAALMAGYRGIVVANAGRELLNGLGRQEVDGGFPAEIHFSSHPYAKGVLEGGRHFGIFT